MCGKLPQVSENPCSHCVHLDSMSYCWTNKVYWNDMFGKTCDAMEYEDWVQDLVKKTLEEYARKS